MAEKTNIAVLVSGGGTNLQALLDAQAAGRIPDGRIVLVLASRAGVGAIDRAEKADVPHVVCDPHGFPDRATWESAMRASLDRAGAELLILAGFMSILSADFVAAYPRRILNVHPSLIPAFCGEGYYGLHVHRAALARGVRVTGATVHYVNEIPDGGEILFQKPVEVRPDDTPETLQRRVMEEAEWVLLPRAAEEVSRRIQEEKENGK